jgi:hypothetical protein
VSTVVVDSSGVFARSPESPFPGLRPYHEPDWPWFFGRGHETNDLLKRLRRVRFLAVVGPSGCGKTSLVRAGLLPAIRDGYLDAEWRIAKFRPGERPLDNLAGSLSPEHPARVRKMLESSSMGLVRAVQMLEPDREPHVLILVDQFEELFQVVQRKGERAHEETKAFLKLLLAAAASDVACIYVAITMRLEWLNESASYAGLAEAINEGMYLVPAMARRQFEQSILGPIEKAGGALTSALLDRMLNDLEGRTDQLPILQHALMRMWQKRQADAPLDLDAYDAVGGFANCLELHAEKVYQEQFDESARCAAEGLFRSITQVYKGRKVRRPRPLREIAGCTGFPIEVLVDVIEKFGRPGRSFLVTTPGKLGEDSVIDIAHEALIRQWTRLRGWVEHEADVESRVERLEAVAAEWDQGQRRLNSLLYRGSVLKAAEHWKLKFRAGGPAIPFLEASRRAEIWSEVWRNGLLVLAPISLCCVIALGVVMHANSDNERERRAAKAAEQAARAAELEQRKIADEYAAAVRELKRQIDYQDSLKTLAVAAAQNPQSPTPAPIIRAIGAKRVYLQYGGSNQAGLANEVKKALIQQHYAVPDFESVGSRAPKQTEVHYFNPQDNHDATAIASVLGGVIAGSVEAKQATNQNNVVPRGQFEVWLGTDSVALKQAPINLQLETIQVHNSGPQGSKHYWQLSVVARIAGSVKGQWSWPKIELDADTKVGTAANLPNVDIDIDITGQPLHGKLSGQKNFVVRGRGRIPAGQRLADIPAVAVDQNGKPMPGQGNFDFVFKKI